MSKQNKQEQIKPEIIEKLADIEHQRWSDWQSYCHKVLRENCPSPELESILKRWDRQIATSYQDLSESEKESDRNQVRRYEPIISDLITQTRQEAVEIVKQKKKKHWHIIFEGDNRPAFAIANKSFNKEVIELLKVFDQAIKQERSRIVEIIKGFETNGHTRLLSETGFWTSHDLLDKQKLLEALENNEI